jgi:hypothetical protein
LGELLKHFIGGYNKKEYSYLDVRQDVVGGKSELIKKGLIKGRFTKTHQPSKSAVNFSNGFSAPTSPESNSALDPSLPVCSIATAKHTLIFNMR